jgi:hypothetical protein
VRLRGSFQRRLVKLELTIKVPTLEERSAMIWAKALRNVSTEDLEALRSIVIAGMTGDITDSPEPRGRRTSRARRLPAPRNTH